MITRVRVKNFRSLADVDVTLGPLTVLVGRNGAGKSAFVDVLRFVRDALRYNLETAISDRGGYQMLRHSSAGADADQTEIRLWVEIDDFRGEYMVRFGSDSEGVTVVYGEEARFSGLQANADFEVKNGRWVKVPGDPHNPKLPLGFGRPESFIGEGKLVLPALGAVMREWARLTDCLKNNDFYELYPNTLRSLNSGATPYPLTGDGGNLAAALKAILETVWREDLIAALRQAVPDISDAKVEKTGGYLIVSIQHDNGQGQWLDLTQESDGTLRLLGMLVALYQDREHENSRLIAIEEPEIALHPGVLAPLSEVIRETALKQQILITTQSPDLISRFAAEELRVVERTNGITSICPLDERQRQIVNDQLFSAGDLLRIEGLHSETDSSTEITHA